MNITIYTKKDCIYCNRAKHLLNTLNLEYDELILDRDFTREELKEKFPEARTFPQIVIDGNNIGGYDQLVLYNLPNNQNGVANNG